MPSDPLGLQDNPLFKIIGKIANPESYRGLAGKRATSVAGSREPMPDYAGMNARQQAGLAKKSKPAVKGAAPVKKVIKKSAKKVAPKAAAKKPVAKGKTEAPGMKSKGKKADKAVEMKKFVKTKAK
jgi:hypothetical protein